MTWNLCWIDFSCPFCTSFKLDKLTKKVFRGGGKSDQNHVDKRILGGKGLQYEDSTSITFVRPVHFS